MMSNRNRTISLLVLSGLLLLIPMPARASSPILWGLLTSSSPTYLAVETYGIAILAIFIIEALVIKLTMDVEWKRAFIVSIALNTFSAVFGALIGLVAFSSAFSMFMAFMITPLVAVWLIRPLVFPRWYLVTAIACVIIGAFISAWPERISSPQPQWFLLLIAESSLVFGFGTLLLIEAVAARIVMFRKTFWKTLFFMNLATFLTTLIVFPFLAPNIYASFNLRDNIRDYVAAGETEKAIELLHLKRANPAYILGVSYDNSTIDDYRATLELIFLERYIDAWPEESLRIARDTLTIDTLARESRVRFEWFEQYYVFQTRTQVAVENGDQSALNEIYFEWVSWAEENSYPDSTVYTRESDKWNTDPAYVTGKIISQSGSDLSIPSLE